ncbi:MAG: ParB/RepB/Spo0J family partition protein [candidate division WOR-3 bacterium]
MPQRRVPSTNMSRRALGKGLAAIIPEESKIVAATEARQIPISEIRTNPFQPRQNPDKALNELAASIKENGVIQAIVVRRRLNGFELIVGERRLRAAKLAGLTHIPAVIKDASEPKMLELALTENIQRADLDPIETAMAYKRLADEFNLTHEEIALKVGKSRSAVSNALRLLALPQKVREAISSGQLSEGHARALLAITSRQTQEELAVRIIEQQLSVREVEVICSQQPRRRQSVPRRPDPNLQAMIEALEQRLGTRVRIRGKDAEGEIIVQFHSAAERERIINLILGRSS